MSGFLNCFLSPALTGKKIGGGEVPVITKCFLHYQEFFKKNSGAENLLLRVHERYSDLSGAERKGGELR